MTREVNCLPRRIKSLLGVINQGEMAVMARMIEDSRVCPDAAECEVENACGRIHAAFLPLAPKI